MHKFDPRKRSLLDDPKRFLFENPDAILSEIGVNLGHVVADIGAGTGFFTLPLAEYVGRKGRVYALDTSPTMIKELRKRTKKLKQVKSMHSQENRFPIKNENLHFALLVNMIHELDDWRRFLKEVHRVLKPGGRICVIDWKKKKMKMGPPLEIRLTKKRIGEMLRQSGYGRIKSLSPLPFHNGLIGANVCVQTFLGTFAQDEFAS
jgi:ubiquinone/menaquinone biosynthesis C-methylase UbiE